MSIRRDPAQESDYRGAGEGAAGNQDRQERLHGLEAVEPAGAPAENGEG